MSAAKISVSGAVALESQGETCKVMVLYENTAARAKAVTTCRRLAGKLEHAPVFEFDWWRFSCLGQSVRAQLAEEEAAAADIVLFALAGEEFPVEIVNWLENWRQRRSKSPGLLVLVTTWSGNFLPLADTPMIQLEEVARRHGMDFLSETLLPAMEISCKPLFTDAHEFPTAADGDRLAEVA